MKQILDIMKYQVSHILDRMKQILDEETSLELEFKKYQVQFFAGLFF